MRGEANRYPQEAARLLREAPQVRESVTGATFEL